MCLSNLRDKEEALKEVCSTQLTHLLDTHGAVFSKAHMRTAGSKHMWTWWNEVLRNVGCFVEGTHYNTRATMHKLVKYVVLPCIKVVPSATCVERTNSHYKYVGGLWRSTLSSTLQ